MAVQSRVNGELGARTGDSVAAGLTGFSVGFVIVLLGTALIPAGRRGLITALGAFRVRRLPAVFLLSGVFGAFLVVVQTFTTPLVGVSVFILGMVVGQSVGGLGVDRAGIGPGGIKPLTGWRLLGTGIIVISVLIAQLPHIGDDGAEARSPALVLALLLLPVLVPSPPRMSPFLPVTLVWNPERPPSSRLWVSPPRLPVVPLKSCLTFRSSLPVPVSVLPRLLCSTC